ncbi:MAG: tRNA uridine-5-carboxymethylaminomethyl(34) synthesis GTPase MnmE [Candidatus Dasytiphilus stammeri]
MNYSETIVAQATPLGHGGVSMLRISGKQAATVAIHVLGKLPSPRLANYLSFRDTEGKIIDQGITIWFPAPNSFTGEDTLELHSHGSPIVIEMLLRCITKIPNVRLARPGEFSERAFINNKIDLTQAEAIVDLINASSEQVARSALKSLQGDFSEHIRNLIDLITNLRIYIEAAIDFPNDIDYFSNREVESKLNEIINLIGKVHIHAYQGNLLREGINIVIVGRPNAGKSSIFNALTKHDIAIVNDLPGTTRDVLRDQINLDGRILNLIDTAGIHQTNNVVEIIGIERAWKEIKQAHHILFIVDGSIIADVKNLIQESLFHELISKIPKGIELTVIRNKIDLTGEVANIMQCCNWNVINVSANQGYGIPLIKNHLKNILRGQQNLSLEEYFLARSRHLQLLKKTQQHLEDGKKQLIKFNGWDLLAEELRVAQQLLNEIIGKFVSEDLLEKIFATFCIGK